MQQAAGPDRRARCRKFPHVIEQERRCHAHGSPRVQASPIYQRKHRSQHQNEGEAHDLSAGKARVPIKIREHVVARAAVVLAIHQRNSQEMRKLPKKEDGEQKPRLPIDSRRSSRPADQSGHGPRKRAQKSAEGRLPLQWGIDPQVREQCRNRQESRQKIHCQQQIQSTRHAQQNAEPQRLAAREPARRQRPGGSAAHLAIPNPLHPLIQSCRAAGNQ